MIRLAALLATFLTATPVQAEGPNLSTSPGAAPGTAQRLVLAQRSWQQALTTGEALTMLV
ncbi:MAG: hypothetical protein HC783_15380, partial [Rhodobacteraceae bacterium]|nr:hypothetical protein [Paracoccaceae bacterium]